MATPSMVRGGCNAFHNCLATYASLSLRSQQQHSNMVRLAHWRAAIIAQLDKSVNLHVETLPEVDPHRDPMYNVLGAGTVTPSLFCWQDW
jgi:hypothetical protein